MEYLLSNHKKNRKLTTLVENYTIYNSSYSELSIFETHQTADKVSLKFDHPVIASLLTGKKVMHLEGIDSFKFSPGESVVIPAGKEMLIDFPDATRACPTQCLALTIDPERINQVVDSFNENVIIDTQENGDWKLDNNSFSFK